MVPSVVGNMTAGYTALDAWFYDAFIAPAVLTLGGAVQREYLPALPTGGSLLDVGCGGGQLAVMAAERREDLAVTGVDLSPSQIERARRRARALNGRARFVVGSACDLPFADATYDCVVSVCSLKHWPDQDRGLAECVRVLKPGGRLQFIEVDRGCRFDDARDFVATWRLPSFSRPLVLSLFRTYVVGQALDLDDARAAFARLPMAEVSVTRIRGMPALALSGRK